MNERNTFWSAAVACATALTFFATGCAKADEKKHPDFSKLDPVWAATQIDNSLQSSDMKTAWAAIKQAFPEDYKRLTREIATAQIQNRQWSGISQQFMQDHLAGNVRYAQSAPEFAQAEYQKQKAKFISYLSHSNVAACSYLSTGVGDASALGDPSIMRQYSNLLAATVKAIDAGRRSPTAYAPVTPADAAAVKAIMMSQGASDVEAQRALAPRAGLPPSEACREGVLRNDALAAAPAALVGKVAFR
jgi:hypothetical protein